MTSPGAFTCEFGGSMCERLPNMDGLYAWDAAGGQSVHISFVPVTVARALLDQGRQQGWDEARAELEPPVEQVEQVETDTWDLPDGWVWLAGGGSWRAILGRRTWWGHVHEDACRRGHKDHAVWLLVRKRNGGLP